jgi:DNA polymerase
LARKTGCWRGIGDAAPYVPGLPPGVPRFRSLRALFESMACCTRCELAPGRTQVVRGMGASDARLMLVGEAPGAREDREGRPFVGQAGRLLDALLAANGIPRDEVFITNVVACRPPANRTPKAREVAAHAPWLEEQLRLVRPDLLVTLGRIALACFLRRARITRIRGTVQAIERDGRTIPLLPLLHPAAILRNRRQLLPAMEADFRKIRELLGY